MLASFLSTHRSQVEALAQAWLADGASAYGVWDDRQLLAHWQNGTAPTSCAWTSMLLEAGDQVLGSLRVAGTDGPTAQARLAAEAALIARLIQAETELDVMTGEMVDTQDQLLALYDLTRSTRAHLDLDGTLELLAQESARLARTGAAFAVLCLDPPDGPVRLQQTPGRRNVPQEALSALFRQVQAAGYRLLLNEDDCTGLLPAGLHNLVLEPVEVRGRILAGLGLMNKPGAFTSPDLKLLRAIAEQAGAQIENVLLQQEVVEQTRLQTEMEVARRVQLRLLPNSAPKTPGCDVYGTSHPALQVGGDFFDFILRPNHPITFAVGDVSGKGMPAALLMAMSHTVIRNKARFNATPTPENILLCCNEELYDDFTEVGAFATVFVGQYDHAVQRLTYANAGHSPVIFCPAPSGPARMLEADGPPVGVLPMSLCRDQYLDLKPGDVLVIASDGFSEARGANDELFGYDRLLQMVEAFAHRTAQEIAAALFDAVASFAAGHPQDDDQTLVVVKASTGPVTDAEARGNEENAR